MALRGVASVSRRNSADSWFRNVRTFVTTAHLCKRVPPLGPMPNEEIDVSSLESLEKYRSYTRYLRAAEEARSKPAWWKTYRSHLEGADPEHGAERVDIGLPCRASHRRKEEKERRQVMRNNRSSVELERAARLRTLKVDLDRVQETWEQTAAPFHVRRLADHYGVFRDLFPNAYFLPQVTLRIRYGQDGAAQVHHGNRLTPTQAASPPEVSFAAEEGSLWTLLLTSPDEHLQDSEAEYVHWLLGNVPGAAVQEGEELCHYLPPFPARGTGFQRFVFVLFKQDGRVDFQEDARPSPCLSLQERTFKTLDFYRKHQDHMTPAGLAFFQSQWDESVTDTFHAVLRMREPVFEFVRPPVYHPPQVKYPHGQPLRYLDRYRDGQEHTYGIY
ncbi:39S ribosomal protein L38, mitochondrial [Oryzias melastigma]|uniref:Large ribosomal subunit protein mL38 n=1 Tax=Oryzias melastigma TaxID=30732 RepID=A0A3B3BUD6_ORYME|nr:39S ribosomal protein L38, mitochondrial [Oryzias melastigma]